MSDIAERLRAIYATHPIATEAAAEIDRLREALTKAEAEAEHQRKQAAYWHARYAEICKNRGRLDALNKSPIFGSGAKETGK